MDDAKALALRFRGLVPEWTIDAEQLQEQDVLEDWHLLYGSIGASGFSTIWQRTVLRDGVQVIEERIVPAKVVIE